MRPYDQQWWQHFFESPAAFKLGLFPDDAETDREVQGLLQMLNLQPGQRVADICCGAGRHLVRLAPEGLELVGLDSSSLMIDLARQAMAERDVRAGLVRGDARSLPFRSGCFDVVLNLFNSFGYLPTDEENEAMLGEMARCLRPGGRLFLDTRNREQQILFAPYEMEVTLPDGTLTVMNCHYRKDARRMDSIWHDPEDSDIIHYRASIRLYGLDELDAMMTRAGLRRIAVYGSYKGEDFEGFQRELLYVAQKL